MQDNNRKDKEQNLRTQEEIVARLRNYYNSLDHVKDIQRINVLKQAALELSWVLGEESNIKFGVRK